MNVIFIIILLIMYYGDQTIPSINPEPGDRIREYEVIETIGKGGMATVYKARHTLINQIVAIKIMNPSLTIDSQFCERFIREAKTQAQLAGHPNIVTIHNYIEEDNTYIIVMEYIEGSEINGKKIRTLAQFIEKHGALGSDRLKPILDGVISGLVFAHEQQVIHRDIKPSNIMLSKMGVTKISDFGIVHIIADQKITKTGIAVGTPKYMSPEQVRGKELDARSDIYSLGITMYEALTGQTPFKGDTDYEIMRQHEDTAPAPPRSIKPDIPELWENIILTCIAKDPQQRPQQCSEIHAMLAGEKQVKKIPAKKTKPAEKPSKAGPPAQPVNIKNYIRIGGSVVILLLLILVYYFGIYSPGRKKNAIITIPDSSLVTKPLEPGEIMLKRYIDLGRLISRSTYIINAFILCNEDNLNEVILQLLNDEPELVYVHFTDNNNKVVASTNDGVIGAEYRSDFIRASDDTVYERNNFYEGAYTVSIEGNKLGALFFSARIMPNSRTKPVEILTVRRYNSIGNFIAHSSHVEDMLIQRNRSELNDIIKGTCNSIRELDYIYVLDNSNIIISSNDTSKIGKQYTDNKNIADSVNFLIADHKYLGLFNVTVGNRKVGSVFLSGRY